ncbi:MAG: prepilin-type N-terminal cleavage/methylation domain-containing protein [Verrucomicrobia bacterium]|nr:prepilin-type N-terminal cleavage/methylation domain-containing protein [Verrucomicrobiota bacterium]
MKHNTRHRTAPAGFTLVELLVVIAVIGILAGLIFGAVTSSQQRAKIVNTRSFVGQIDAALTMFKSDFGHPPYDSLTAGETTNDKEWIRLWLTGLKDNGDPDDTGANAVRSNPLWGGGPYIEPDPKMLGDCKNTDETESYKNAMLDMWGNPIYFQFKDADGGTDKPIFNIDRWDIWSLGPDEDGSEDMRAFQSQSTYELKRTAYKNAANNRDNIGNW